MREREKKQAKSRKQLIKNGRMKKGKEIERWGKASQVSLWGDNRIGAGREVFVFLLVCSFILQLKEGSSSKCKGKKNVTLLKDRQN